MKITIKASVLVAPATTTPEHVIWNSDIDLVTPRVHIPTVYFYKPREYRGLCNRQAGPQQAKREPRVRDGNPGKEFDSHCGRAGENEHTEIHVEQELANGYRGVPESGDAAGGTPSFFSFQHLMWALAKTLVPFYPLAGRLKCRDGAKARTDIDCNSKGALLVEASTGALMADFAGADFATSAKMREFIPRVDPTQHMSASPLLVLQVTSFACGGVALGVGVQHHVADGISALRFVNAWAAAARGLEVDVKLHMDRTLLKARDPPKPMFHHVEYQPPPPLLKLAPEGAPARLDSPATQTGRQVPGGTRKGCSHARAPQPSVAADQNGGSPRHNEHDNGGAEEKRDGTELKEEDGGFVTELFVFAEERLQALKEKAGVEGRGDERPFSTYEALSAHVWRCTAIARGLQDEQLTKLYIATDGRQRLRPPLPDAYFGNVIFTATPVATAGHMRAASLPDVCRCVRGAVRRLDDAYLRSALDFLELQPDLTALEKGAQTFGSPNLGVISWVRLPIYEADFGWGAPLSMGPAGILFEGLAYLLPGPPGDTSLRLSIALSRRHMKRFCELVYDI